MSRPAVFFDRDNTLIVNSEYLGDPAQVELIPGAPEAVARARGLGFAIVIVSNQSGVARGMFSEDDVRAVNDRMDAMLLEAEPRAIVDRHEYCATHPQGTVKAYCLDDDRRKPKPGMILDAAKAMDLDLKRSWLIGDAPRDVEAGHAAGVRTILLRETFRTASPAAGEGSSVEADYVASSLLDAIDFIEMNLDVPQHATLITPPPPFVATTGAALVASTFAAEPIPAPAEPIGVDRLARERAAVTQIASVFAPEPKVHGTANVHAVVPPRQALPEPPPPPPIPPHLLPGAPPTDWASNEPSAREGQRGDRQTVVLLERVVDELRRANDPPQDFSVARMLGGIVQGFALAAFFGAILYRDAPAFTPFIAAAIFLQLLVSSLFLMAR
jgi:D-glycero-D-manno-heptose 1,7-bisphosphate phosphatase